MGTAVVMEICMQHRRAALQLCRGSTGQNQAVASADSVPDSSGPASFSPADCSRAFMLSSLFYILYPITSVGIVLQRATLLTCKVLLFTMLPRHTAAAAGLVDPSVELHI